MSDALLLAVGAVLVLAHGAVAVGVGTDRLGVAWAIGSCVLVGLGLIGLAASDARASSRLGLGPEPLALAALGWGLAVLGVAGWGAARPAAARRWIVGIVGVHAVVGALLWAFFATFRLDRLG